MHWTNVFDLALLHGPRWLIGVTGAAFMVAMLVKADATVDVLMWVGEQRAKQLVASMLDELP